MTVNFKMHFCIQTAAAQALPLLFYRFLSGGRAKARCGGKQYFRGGLMAETGERRGLCRSAEDKAQEQAALKRKDLRRAILRAAALAGGEFGESGLVSYLRAQALAAPAPFLALLGKALAQEEEESAPAVRLIELVPAPAKKRETDSGA